MTKKIIGLLGLMLLLIHGAALTQSLSTGYLRCEDRMDPLGVDNPAPRFSWEINASGKNIMQTAYRILLADDKELLGEDAANLWDSRQVQSAQSIQVVYGGQALQAGKTYYWKVMVWDNNGRSSGWSKPAMLQMGLLQPADWKAAKWIGYEKLEDSLNIIPAAHGNGKKAWGPGKNVLPLMRKDFSVNKPLKKATAFVCGLGHFEMSVNGEKVGDHFLDPGWTMYDKHALYVTFDITEHIQNGANTTGVMLGNGFYYIPRERYRKLTGAFGYPKLLCRIALEYTDGTTEDIVTDESWRTAPGPITFSSIYSGEDYNATLEQEDWDEPGFNDTLWKNAILVQPVPVLASQTAEPLKTFETFSPVKKTKIRSGVYVYDLGQNASGIPQITVRGNRGDTVKIIPAELLKPDGTANQAATGSPCYFIYILKGDGRETWQPRFMYYGFRYLQVEGVSPSNERNDSGYVVLYSVKALHTRNAAARAGKFESSSELFNKTESLIDWAIKSNMVSVFTDCPHREKLGWLEEAHLVGASVRYNYDIAALNRKVIRDMMVSQTAEGLVPEIAPEFVKFDEPFRDSPEWGSNCILLPWYNYQWYADRKALEESYPMMRRYNNYLRSKAKGYILKQGLGDWYDLGPDKPGFSQLTPAGITATAIWHYDLKILSEIATLLGKPEDAKEYNLLAAEVRRAFNDSFFNKRTRQYGTGSQTANAVAVYMGLVEEADKAAVINNIVEDISKRANALTAGDIGYRYLLRVLDDAGRSDVIYAMNNRSDVPGYGYQIARGATALTESWQALPSVSNNHFMLGHILEWFYSGLAGIRPADGSVGFNKIEFRPEIVGDMTEADASYRSPYGTISSAWTKRNGRIRWSIDVPPNTSATVYFPAKAGAVVTQRGGVGTLNGLVEKNGRPILNIGSGKYTFIIRE